MSVLFSAVTSRLLPCDFRGCEWNPKKKLASMPTFLALFKDSKLFTAGHLHLRRTSGGVHSPLDLSEEEWENNIRTNLTGLWLVSKHVCRKMRDAKIKGSVINISSITGLERGQLPGGIAYTASKTGVVAITRVMALELGQYNIRVNAIAPGLFKSEITEGLMHKDWLKNVAMKTAPLRTYGTSDPAMTSVVRHLILDSSEYVTGNIFIVDAGATLPGVPIFSSL